MSNRERIFGDIVVSIMGALIVIGIVASIIDVFRFGWKHISAYGSYKAYAEYETVDGDY